jgi:surfeit locus 1 family protein
VILGIPLRRLWLPALVTLTALGVLVGLGAWQIERMGAKHRLMARVEQRTREEPQPLPPRETWQALHPKGYEYRRVRVTGRFLNDQEALVHGLLSTGPEAIQGFYVLTPLQMPDGAIVIINRGFVPTEKADPKTRAEGQLSGSQTVVGLMRAPEKRGLFIPDDDPGRNSFFIRDPVAIGRAKGLVDVAPFTIDADGTPNPGGWPKGGTTRLVFSDNHLQYAITWFALALGLLAVFGTWVMRERHGPPA